MRSRSKFDIFEGPDSDHERTKPLHTRAKRAKQTVPLTGAKKKRKARPQQVGKELLSRRKKQSLVKTPESKNGERDKPRRSARLEKKVIKGFMKI
jgi:hypothetical protein